MDDEPAGRVMTAQHAAAGGVLVSWENDQSPLEDDIATRTLYR
jgi:hypothetical protein